MGSHGNDNLNYMTKTSFITTDGTSDAGLTLDKETTAVTFYSTADAWVAVGAAPVAAATTEKVWGTSMFIPASVMIDVPVPAGSDLTPMKVAAIQSTASGNVYVYQRKD